MRWLIVLATAAPVVACTGSPVAVRADLHRTLGPKCEAGDMRACEILANMQHPSGQSAVIYDTR